MGWKAAAVLGGAQILKGFLGGKSRKSSGNANASYYNAMASRLESTPPAPFVAPFVPNYTYLQQAKLVEMQGDMAKKRGKVEKKQYYRNAGTSEALSQRSAYEAWREGEIADSDAVASVTGGGGVSTDVLDVRADLAEDSDYNAMSRLYEGKSQATSLRYQGDVAEWQGKADQVASVWNAEQVKATGQYANELGARQNAAASAAHAGYLQDRQYQIEDFRAQAGSSARTGRVSAKNTFINGVIKGIGTGVAAYYG